MKHKSEYLRQPLRTESEAAYEYVKFRALDFTDEQLVSLALEVRVEQDRRSALAGRAAAE